MGSDNPWVSGSPLSPRPALAFTRYCYYQYCMVYSIQTGGRKGSRILTNSCALVLHQGGQCRWAGGLKGWLILARQPRSKRISCKGSPAPPPPRVSRYPTHTLGSYMGNTNIDILGEAKMEYNIIFQRIFNDIPFIGYYRLEDIPYSGVICNIISYFFLRSAYSPHTPGMGKPRPCTRRLTFVEAGLSHRSLAFTRYHFTLKLYCGSPSSVYPPPHLQSLPYCNTIARPFRSKRLLPDPPLVSHTPYSVGRENIL